MNRDESTFEFAKPSVSRAFFSALYQALCYGCLRTRRGEKKKEELGRRRKKLKKEEEGRNTINSLEVG